MFGFVWQKRRNRRHELWLLEWGRARLLGSAHMLSTFLNLGLTLALPLKKEKIKGLRRNKNEERAGFWGRDWSRESEREGRKGTQPPALPTPACLPQASLLLVILQVPGLASGANGEIKHLVPGPAAQPIL